MTLPYTLINDLAKGQPPDKGILSRTLINDERLKVVRFGFAQGEALCEHTASTPAVLHFLGGEAKLMVGDDALEAQPGTWVHTHKGLRHSVQAKTDGGDAVAAAQVSLADHAHPLPARLKLGPWRGQADLPQGPRP